MQVKKMMVRVALKYLGAATQYEVAEYLSSKFGKKYLPSDFTQTFIDLEKTKTITKLPVKRRNFRNGKPTGFGNLYVM